MAISLVSDLETPSVLIDLDKMERNIASMQKRCDDLGINFRPHIKTHKIPDIARRQIEAGAIGIACQKVSEAEFSSKPASAIFRFPTISWANARQDDWQSSRSKPTSPSLSIANR